MDRSELWGRAFATNLRLLDRNLQGFEASLAAAPAAEGIASAAWLLAHVATARRSMLAALGAAQPEDAALAEVARRGGDASALPLEGILERLKATEAPLAQAFAAAGDWDRPLLNPALKREQPMEELVSFLFMHESYHLGQIGLIRKLHGLPGAI